MPDIIADPHSPRCYPAVPGSGIERYQSLGPDLFSSRARDRAALHRGHSGNPHGLAGGRLLVCCRFAARKIKKPGIPAANGENLLQIPCRFSKRIALGQGFRDVRPPRSGASSKSSRVGKRHEAAG
jgi:hypothetical protein